MAQRLESPLSLCWVAFCSAVAAALAYGAALHRSVGARIVAAPAGVVVGTAIALVSLAVLPSLRRSPRDPAGEPAPAAPAKPELVPAPGASTARVSAADDLRERLEARLAAGRELRGGAPDERVAEWVEATRRMLQTGAPGAAGYFGALDLSAWPAHLTRLETILRDFL